jgi:hypothetical protein
MGTEEWGRGGIEREQRGVAGTCLSDKVGDKVADKVWDKFF